MRFARAAPADLNYLGIDIQAKEKGYPYIRNEAQPCHGSLKWKYSSLATRTTSNLSAYGKTMHVSKISTHIGGYESFSILDLYLESFPTGWGSPSQLCSHFSTESLCRFVRCRVNLIIWLVVCRSLLTKLPLTRDWK